MLRASCSVEVVQFQGGEEGALDSVAVEVGLPILEEVLEVALAGERGADRIFEFGLDRYSGEFGQPPGEEVGDDRHGSVSSRSAARSSAFRTFPRRALSEAESIMLPHASRRTTVGSIGPDRRFNAKRPSDASSVYDVMETSTDIPSKASVAPTKLPATGIACRMSRATATGIRLKPPTLRFVGSKVIQPAPGT